MQAMILIEPPQRGTDKHGSGAYKASRGSRTHNGIDIACYKGSIILSPNAGIVTKIGYPYSPDNAKKGHLRYVQVTEMGKYRCRYFYVDPSVRLGQDIRPGDELGVSQGLLEIYPGITDHIHYEVFYGKEVVDPNTYLDGDRSELL